jgi:hypothetical protein
MLINSVFKKQRGARHQIKLYCHDMRDLKLTLNAEKAG